jgi:hypothetical protein
MDTRCPDRRVRPHRDSNAQAAIGQLVDREVVNPIRETKTDLPEWALAYRNFAGAFIALYERADTQAPLKPTVKELDHLLWQPS